METKRIAIVDDHPLMRKGIIASLKKHKDLQFVFEANNGEELLDKYKPGIVDVILLDNKMPKMDGLDTLKIIRTSDSKVKIIILTAFDDEEYIYEFIKAQANGYLLKDVDSEELYNAIVVCLKARNYYPEFVLDALLKHDIHKDNPISPGLKMITNLTPAERKVLKLILDGKSNSDICNLLRLGLRTVERRRSSIMEKSYIHNISGLILFCTENDVRDLLDNSWEEN